MGETACWGLCGGKGVCGGVEQSCEYAAVASVFRECAWQRSITFEDGDSERW